MNVWDRWTRHVGVPVTGTRGIGRLKAVKQSHVNAPGQKEAACWAKDCDWAGVFKVTSRSGFGEKRWLNWPAGWTAKNMKATKKGCLKIGRPPSWKGIEGRSPY